MLYNNDKQQTQDIKKFIKNNPVGKPMGKQEKAPKPTERQLPIRGR